MADEVVKHIGPLVNENGSLNSKINELLVHPYSMTKTKGEPNSIFIVIEIIYSY